MEDVKVISGVTEQEIWQQIDADLKKEEIFDYNALIKQNGKEIQFCIDIDPGGGFEGGWELTWFKAALSLKNDFKFAIHNEGFTDEIGKFFGMQDIETGHPELDKHLIVKSNNEEKVKTIFADEDIRAVFAALEEFDCGIHIHKDIPYLELNIDAGITDPAALRKIYHGFYRLIGAIED